MKIVAVDENGNKSDITDLYFFEEEGIHDFNGKGFHENYTFLFIAEKGDVIEGVVTNR